MAINKIISGDEVVIVTGKDKGKTGRVVRVLDNEKVIVENVNIVKKHQKANPEKGEAGGIIDKEMPLHISNVALFNPETGKGDRVGSKVLDDGRKVRIFKSSGEVVDA